MGKIKRDDLCPCGSGKKYKDCCYPKLYKESRPRKKTFNFTLKDNTKIKRVITSIDSLTKHNPNGFVPDITKEQMMDLCLDEIHKIISKEEVGMLADLVDAVVKEMVIIPTFTYRQIAERMDHDERFNLFQSQICSLKGTDPVELIVKKLDI